MSRFYDVIIPAGFMAVDVFFFMSAFLASHIVLSKFYKKGYGVNEIG